MSKKFHLPVINGGIEFTVSEKILVKLYFALISQNKLVLLFFVHLIDVFFDVDSKSAIRIFRTALVPES